MCDLSGDAQHETRVSRRNFLAVSALAALAPWSIGCAVAADPPPNAIAPEEALKRLMDGNARYVKNTMKRRDFSFERVARVTSQYPIAAILSCADLRVAPEFAFDQGPGDLLVMRVAGNVMSPDLLASLEYAVGPRPGFLGVPRVMVLGHTNCGAVDAAITALKTSKPLPGHLPGLIEKIKPAVITAEKAQPGNLLDNAVEENVRQQVARLKKSPPYDKMLYPDKKIDIVGAVYDLRTGEIARV